MEETMIESAVEALLFAMGGAVTLKELARVLEEDERKVQQTIERMMEKYKSNDRGIQIIELDQSYQMCTKPALYEYLIRMTHQQQKPVLTDAALEVLSIVAYKQPITRIEIDKIRGVNSSHAINRLVEYDLIREAGRLNAPGKPILFATTEEFLRAFGVCSPEELPSLNPEMIETFKLEAEAEINLGIEEDS